MRRGEIWVHPRLGVGTVWRGISATGGWSRLPSLGETQCRSQVWPYGGVRQLGRVRGQAHGRHVRGSDGTGGTWSGWTPSIRHLLRISTPGRRGMLLGGTLRGRSPRTREGRIGPTAQMRGERREGRGESSEKHHFICRQLEWELTLVRVPAEVYESSPQYWDAPVKFLLFDLDSSICYKSRSEAGSVGNRVRPIIGVSCMTNRRAAFLKATTC